MKQRRPFGWRALAWAAAGCAVHGGAWAWINGFNPNITPVLHPDTKVETQVWKLAGTPWGSQIAPTWVLSVAHASAAPGDTFTNSFGSATVTACMTPPYMTAINNTYSPDLKLCHLDKPIVPPAGFAFPPLVEDPRKLVSDISLLDRASPQMGYLLVTGFGMPNAGQQAAAWLDFSHLPGGYTPWTAPPATPIPYDGSGDSGSPIYWFAQGKSAPALVGVSRVGAKISSQQYFGAQELNWIATTVSANSGDQVTTVALASYVAPLAPLAPPQLTRNMADGAPYGMVQGVKVLSSTSNGAVVTWNRPTITDGTKITFYTVATGGHGQEVSVLGVKDTATTYQTAVTGLNPNTDYTTCVIPVNASGSAAFDETFMGTVVDPATATLPVVATGRDCVGVYTGPAPDRVVDVSVVPITTSKGVKTFRATWSAPTTPAGVRVTNYRLNITENDVSYYRGFPGNQTVYTGGVLDPNTSTSRICVQVTPYGATWIQGEVGVPSCVFIQH